MSDIIQPDNKDIELFKRRAPGVPEKVSKRSDFFEMIERLASNPQVDVNKIQQLVDMHKDLLDRENQTAFNAAMVRAEGKITEVIEDEKNAQTSSRYASFKNLAKMVIPIAREEGLATSFYEGVTEKEGNIRVCADVRHDMGHVETYWVDIPLDDRGPKGTINKTQPHAKISSMSYGKSALTKLIWNIPTGEGDDDGNAGGPEYITDKQVEIIKKLIAEKNVDESMFLAYVDAEKLEEIDSKKYKDAVANLRRKNKPAPPQREPGSEG